MTRAVVWRGLVEWLAEHAVLELQPGGVRASGVQLGAEPLPYRLDYTLDATGPGWTTRSLDLRATGDGWSRRLVLRRADDGAWAVEGEGDAGALDGALDCDLGFSPLTNLMPVRRHALHATPGAVDFTMALVAVPELRVAPSAQRYEHVREGLVQFSAGDFAAELRLDDDGLALTYPELAERV